MQIACALDLPRALCKERKRQLPTQRGRSRRAGLAAGTLTEPREAFIVDHSTHSIWEVVLRGFFVSERQEERSFLKAAKNPDST